LKASGPPCGVNSAGPGVMSGESRAVYHRKRAAQQSLKPGGAILALPLAEVGADTRVRRNAVVVGAEIVVGSRSRGPVNGLSPSTPGCDRAGWAIPRWS